jgi:D-serine dehydratase
MTDSAFGTRYRSWPATDESAATAVASGRHVSELMMPALTLLETALEHNATVMADWVAGLGFDLAPHGKTSMSPELTARQLRHGAWAITAATAGQARMFAGWGVPRIILANEVTDPGSLRWVAETVAAADVKLLVLVDSVTGVELLSAALAAAGAGVPLDVLLEWGIPGGRAGVRTLDAAREVASAVTASAHVRLAGVECFEGVAGHDRSPVDEAAVVAMITDLVTLLAELAASGGFAGLDEVVLTAGGSSYPDLVAAAFEKVDGAAGIPVRKVLRSGGYLTHDHGMLHRSSPMRAGAHNPAGTLLPALRLHASVLSTPEPGLAIVGFGKRDAPFDIDLPIPLAVRPRADLPDGPVVPLTDVSVARCNDQHAFLAHNGELAVGDQVVFGISHPSTAFDKWSLVPVLDDDERIVDLVTTSF